MRTWNGGLHTPDEDNKDESPEEDILGEDGSDIMGDDDPSLNAPAPPIGARAPPSSEFETPPPGFRYVCPECGKWKTVKGKPYTQGGLNFHRLNKHNVRGKPKPPEPKATADQFAPPSYMTPAVAAPTPAMYTPAVQQAPAQVPQQKRDDLQLQDDDPNMRAAAEDLNYDSFVNRERKRNLVKALNANNLMAKVAKQYVLNNWEINSSLQEDPTQFYDFLMRIPEMLKHVEWARDIVDITFMEGEPTPPPSPYYSPRGRGRGAGQPQSYYNPQAPRQPYGYSQQQGYGRQQPDPYGQPDPRDMGYKSPWEVEEEKRKEREAWERDRRADELEKRNNELSQALSNPPPPPINPADIIQKTVEALVQKLQPTQASPETTAMREELRMMRDEQARLRGENERTKTEISVQNAMGPVTKELQDLRAQNMARDADARARQQTVARYESQQPRAQGMSDDATVAIKEVESATQQFTTVAGNLNNTMNNFINAMTRIIAPGAPGSNVNTAGMTDAEKAELDRIAKQG